MFKVSLIIAFGSFVYWSIAITGEYVIAPILISTFSGISQFAIFTLTSSLLPTAITSVLLFSFLQKRPPIIISTEGFLRDSFGFIVGTWLLIFLIILFFDVERGLSLEIFSTRDRVSLGFILVTLILLGPMLEEYIFRGVYLEYMVPVLGLIPSTIVTSIIFIGYHAIWIGISVVLLILFIFSILFSLAYVRGGLVGSFIVHSFVNFYFVVLYR
jgi:membrane protease YdiL (CAAX protease family)